MEDKANAGEQVFLSVSLWEISIMDPVNVPLQHGMTQAAFTVALPFARKVIGWELQAITGTVVCSPSSQDSQVDSVLLTLLVLLVFFPHFQCLRLCGRVCYEAVCCSCCSVVCFVYLTGSNQSWSSLKMFWTGSLCGFLNKSPTSQAMWAVEL